MSHWFLVGGITRKSNLPPFSGKKSLHLPLTITTQYRRRIPPQKKRQTTTITELSTIAAAAYSGRNITCVNGYNTPAASGIRNRLYANA